MENMYLILVVVLFALAISDLIVGVSNDAVNFLNSALGSKAVSFKLIMAIAALGIFVGATFSSGMMEVARKGIFHPEHFFFSEIIAIFLAVMIADVILLDLFNTYGFPTSTTVSIVFELLGAAVAVSLIKIYSSPDALDIVQYINTGKALAIISGILLSVVVAFSVGAIVQYFTRLLFSFDYENRLKYFGALWGGIAVTAITYFILIKGAKGASFMSPELKISIKENTFLILSASFIFWTFVMQILKILFKIDILKIIVLVGTFALAMAFAGNDLVNFIGVPLAGFESFKAYVASGGISADAFSMGALSKKIQTPPLFLIIAGFIMVATLWSSKKAKSVVKTSLDLGRQDEGAERFGSSLFARTIVRASLNVGDSMRSILPQKAVIKLEKQFDQTAFKERIKHDAEPPSFDMIRASVILLVSSILISFATSLKLPLSTTYVTFMVAMGASLADKSWGRESAVYRITGVASIIGGWFFTAFTAFSLAFVMANIIYFGGIFGIGILIIIAGIVVFRTHRIHHKRSKEEAKANEEETLLEKKSVFEKCKLTVVDVLDSAIDVYDGSIKAINLEDRKQLFLMTNNIKKLNMKTKSLKDNIPATIKKLEEDSIHTGPFYVQVLDYLRETAHCISFIVNPGHEHINNNHKGFIDVQKEELNNLRTKMEDVYSDVIQVINDNSFLAVDTILEKQRILLDEINDNRKKQIRRIKNEEVGTKNSMLYLAILHESKNLLLHTVNLLKAQRDFVLEKV